jgi:predicted metal-dependent peptidase
MSETLKRIQRARTILLIDQPFFGVLALQLEIIESTINDTAWTDGKRLGFNPAFVAKLSQDELIGVVAHEVMHPACGHPWREGGREHKRWNAAADYAINPIIKGAGLKLPAGCLDDPQYHGKSAEWIYDRLPPSQESDGCGIGETKPGDGEPGEGDTPVTEADWQQLAKQAMQAAKIQGKLPANMARELERATKPIVDWRTLLRKYLQQITTADYTWTRPNKRYLSHGIILPSLRSLACGKIAIAVDTSGSIDQVTLAQFAGEMQSIIDDMSPSSTEVV